MLNSAVDVLLVNLWQTSHLCGLCHGAKSSIHTFLHQKQNPATCHFPHLPGFTTPIHPSPARGRSRLRLAAGDPLAPTHPLRGWAVRCQQWSALVHVWLICRPFNVFTWERGNEAEHVLKTVDCSGPVSCSVTQRSEGSRPQHPEEGLVFLHGMDIYIMCNWINSETVQCLFWLGRTSNPFTVPQRTRSVAWCATCLPSQVQAKHCALKWAISAVREGGQRNSAAVSTSQQSTQDTALHCTLCELILHFIMFTARGEDTCVSWAVRIGTHIQLFFVELGFIQYFNCTKYKKSVTYVPHKHVS